MNFYARLAVMLMGLVLSATALGHAMLDHATPAVGSTLRVAPGRVDLWFTEPLEPAFSSVRVLDASGRQVDRRDASVDKSDRRHFSVSMSSMPAGRYRVVWRVVYVDKHATQGDFIFDVSP